MLLSPFSLPVFVHLQGKEEERVTLVYLSDFLNNVTLQEVSGAIQREIIASSMASVIQLLF